jgi:chaperonin GroES
MRYEPLANRIIMEPVAESKVTAGNIVIPDIATRNKHVAFGKVIAVGPGRNTQDGGLIPCHVKVGDIVLFPRNAPAALPLLDSQGNEDMVLMCPENDIIAVVHDLPRQSSIVGLDGALLAMEPSSLALPDQVYENRDGIDRSVYELTKANAPPDVIADVDMRDE